MLPLIPYPQRIEEGDGSPEIAVGKDGEPVFGRVKSDFLPEEGYELIIGEEQTELKAATESGYRYGEVTLNLIASAGNPSTELRIHDKPRYRWRGYMLDVSRYFFSVDDIMKQIDFMAVMKLNVLHLHLTDDQGWRVEIKKYPRLTEIGAWRRRTLFRLKRHGGYYTQEELKSIVSYAHERGIKVVPEIEFPGHFTAAVAAYPELGCYGEGARVAETFGIKHDVACLGNPAVIDFIKDVLSELFPIFTDEYYHIGGDEVPAARYELCPKCRAEKERLGAGNWAEVQAHFVNEIAAFLKENGKKTITWNETEPTGIPDKEIIWQYWQGGLKEEALVKEINAGRTVIMSPAKPYYLDLPYSENTLQAIAEYKDVPEGADPDRILGLEFPLWTELVPDEETAERRLFPRLLLMAEKAWRGECESSFLYRCEEFGKVLTDLGATIKKKVPLPPKGLKGLLDVMWFNRCRLYWGAIPNLIRNAKVAKIAKQRIKETENEK